MASVLETNTVQREVISYLRPGDVHRIRRLGRRHFEAARPFFNRNHYVSFDNREFSMGNFVIFLQNSDFIPSGLKLRSEDISSVHGPAIYGLCGPSISRLEVDLEFLPVSNFSKIIQVYTPNLQTLTVTDLLGWVEYTDPEYVNQLQICNLTIKYDQNFCLEEDAPPNALMGTAMLSIVRTCRRLKQLSLQHCHHMELTFRWLSSGQGFRHLVVLAISPVLSPELVTVIVKCAQRGQFNLLKKLEISSIHVDSLCDMHTFLVLQPAIHAVWIPDCNGPPHQPLHQSHSMFNQIGGLEYLTNLCIVPLFHLSALSPCIHLYRLILYRVFEPAVYGIEGDSIDEIVETLFAGVGTLASVRKLKISISSDPEPPTKQNTDDILKWFPRVEELNLRGIHPASLASIWGLCQSVVKLSVSLSVNRYNFYFDEIFTGYTRVWCQTCRENDGDIPNWIFDEVPGPSISMLHCLTSLQIHINVTNAYLGYNDAEDKSDNKMSDLSFLHGVYNCINLKHFEFHDLEDGYIDCVQIGVAIRVLNSKRYFKPEFRTTMWDSFLCAVDELPVNGEEER